LIHIVQVSSDLSSKQLTDQAIAQSSAKSQTFSEDDRTTLSSDAASLSSLTSAALSSPDIRQGRVDNLRQAISNGEYKVDPDSIASAMVGETT